MASIQNIVADSACTWNLERLWAISVASKNAALHERLAHEIVENAIHHDSPSEEKRAEVNRKTKSFLDNLIGSVGRIPEGLQKGYSEGLAWGAVAKVRTAWEFRGSLGDFDNRRGNAVEHCYWGSLMAQNVSKEYAKEVAIWWESDETDPAQRQQDLHNTLAGLSFGAGNSDAWAQCQAAADNGALQFTTPSNNQNSDSSDEPGHEREPRDRDTGRTIFEGDINIDPDIPNTA